MIRTGLGEMSIEFNSGHQLNWQLYLIKTPVTIIIGTGLGVGETSIEFNSGRQLWQLYVVVHGKIMKTSHNYLTISYTLLSMWWLWKHSIPTWLLHSFYQPTYMDMKNQINICFLIIEIS